MNQRDQIIAFGDDLDRLLERYAQEFDLPYAAVVGCMQIKIHLICQQASEEDDD